MDQSLSFENTMRQFFGDKAQQIAYSENIPSEKKKWLKKLIKRLKKDINNLDTSINHKQLLNSSIAKLQSIIEKKEILAWEMNYALLRLCGRLLGYSPISQKPCILWSPIYHQNADQYLTEYMLNDMYPVNSDENDTFLTRKKLILQLIEEGLSTYRISMIFNITEYEVKKILLRG